MAERIKKNIILAAAVAAITGILVFALILKGGDKSVFSQTGASGKIVIDAGHGLPDAGATGVAGTKEEEINLQISEKLKRCFEDEGFSVIMTRGGHDAIADSKKGDMAARRRIISQSGQDVTVSIHQNIYDGDSSVRGAQVFFAPGSEEGAKLASAIQRELNAAIQPDRPKTEQAGDYYIVKSGESPAVIVECGFISNAEDEALLKKSQYQISIVRAIKTGVLNYLGGENPAS